MDFSFLEKLINYSWAIQESLCISWFTSAYLRFLSFIMCEKVNHHSAYIEFCGNIPVIEVMRAGELLQRCLATHLENNIPFMWEQIKVTQSDFSEPVKLFCFQLPCQQIVKCYYVETCFSALHSAMNQWAFILINVLILLCESW
jgi:hypothetical protein